MEDSELFLFIVKFVVIFICTWVIIKFIKGVIAFKNAKTAQFFVKVAFGFERKDRLIGSLIYYNESDMLDALSAEKVDLYNYVVNFLPALNFPINPIPALDVKRSIMASRVSIEKEVVDKYRTIIIMNKRGVVTINRMGTDPRKSWWFGTALYSNNEDVVRVIAYKIRKARKHDTACHVVWS